MIEKATRETSVTRKLTLDHVRLDILFEDACRFADGGDLERAAGGFDELARGLRHHIAVEERLLFPAFDARVPMPGPTAVMLKEERVLYPRCDAALDEDEQAEITAALARGA